MPKPLFIVIEIVPLPEDLKTELNIIQMPSPLIVDGIQQLDNNLPMPLHEFGQMLLTGKHSIETAVLPPSAYTEVYKDIPKDTPVYVVNFSPKLSGFYKSAQAAAEEFPEHSITMVETTFCPPAMLLLAMSAAKQAEKMDDPREIHELIMNMRSTIQLYHALFSLKYLHQAGRINAAKALLGSMIKLVPIISTDQEGMIVPAAKTRRIEKSLAKICDLVERDLDNLGSDTIDVLVTHTGNEANGRALKQMVEERFTVNNCWLVQSGYCMMRYVGPDSAGLSYYAYPKK